jgi:hypothetical protein
MKNSVLNKCKYDSYAVFPASLFFEIRDSKNYQLMKPKPRTSTEWLEKMFLQVFDDYFMKLDNEDAKRYLELLENEKIIECKIVAFKSVLKFHWETPPNLWNNPTIVKIRIEQITALNKYLDSPFDLENNFNEELMNTLSVSIGILENDLTITRFELEDLRKEHDIKPFEFYDSIQNINEVNMHGQINSTCLLPEYVAAVKSASKKARLQKFQQLKKVA